ncbi:MAG TPA: hypothetical protein DEB60_00700 [Brevundimonas sp.]|nr:hypothetical protein [Brevundimonas sp.]
MNPDPHIVVAFAQLLQSEAAHFILPRDLSEQASAWLLSQGIEHEANDLYIMGRQHFGGSVISIADEYGAFCFRMWGDDTVIGPVAFSSSTPHSILGRSKLAVCPSVRK